MPSDVTVHGGRLFANDAPWNRPLLPGAPIDGAATARIGQLPGVVCATGPRVVHVDQVARDVWLAERDETGTIVRAHSGRLPVGIVPAGDLIVVDHRARTVTAGRRWTATEDGYDVELLDVTDLDGDGWGSPALGIVLERELLSGIGHAVGLWLPFDVECYGMTVRVPSAPESLAVLDRTVVDALVTYGGIVVGIHDGPEILIRVERSKTATTADLVGPTYRQLGMGADPWPLQVASARIEALA